MVKRISSARDSRTGHTMQDIASIVGVSQATVSYVLSGKPGARVSPETRRRVLEAAARVHYRPNAIARAMASGRSRTIGVYQPHVSHSPLSGMWNTAVMRGIGEALHQRHYHLLLYGYRQQDEPPPAAFLDGRVEGLIILAPHRDDSLPCELARTGCPVAVIGGGEWEGAIIVDVDNRKGGRLATEHLLRLGHTHIAHLMGPPDVPNAIDRRRGYEEALCEAGIPLKPEYLVPTGFDERSGFASAKAVLSMTPRPTALFVANDVAALGVLMACIDLGLRVPADVAVVGYDDSPICTLTRPTLTSVRQPASQLGRAAAESLLAMICDRSSAIRQHILPPELVVRDSCGGNRETRAVVTYEEAMREN